MSADPGGRGARAPVVVAGLLGGAAAGLLDGTVTALGASGTGLRGAWLGLLDAGLTAMTGALLAAALLGLHAVCARLAGEDRGLRVAVALLGAPVVLFDAFALFAGQRAARVPAHHLLSGLIAAGALVGLGYAVGPWRRALAAAGRDRRWRGWGAGALAALGGLVFLA